MTFLLIIAIMLTVGEAKAQEFSVDREFYNECHSGDCSNYDEEYDDDKQDAMYVFGDEDGEVINFDFDNIYGFGWDEDEQGVETEDDE